MIVTGDWVVPVVGPPIRHGAVLTRGARIDRVGRLPELLALAPDDPVERFDGCVIIPGLVNAHTHLSLTVLGGLVPPTRMRDFLAQVTKAVLAMSSDDFAASASAGALECLECGVTSVGDIVYGPEPLAACADAGVGGVFYWEVLGIDADDLSGELAEAEFPSEVGACTTGRTRCGVSPHTPYTSGPRLLEAAWRVAQRHGTGFAIHAAESPAERELMKSGSGPLLEVAHRLARGFVAPKSGSIAYLDRLGVLAGAVVVHCVHLETGDPTLLKRKAAGVVLCPRSNERLGNGSPPVAELSAAGVRLALGTDSPASNADFDLFEEARAARRLHPGLTARRTLAMMTVDGARTLGLEGHCGALQPGSQADLAVIETGQTEDPERAVVARGGRDTVRAVLGGGIWRVRGGKPAMPVTAIERAAERAREVARRAIERQD
ncbi:MAG TPA: amidohydrolase family protein [Coriobacteriia bacterium]